MINWQTEFLFKCMLEVPIQNTYTNNLFYKATKYLPVVFAYQDRNIVSFGCAGINRLGLFIKWKWWLNHKYIYITVNYNFYIHLQQVYTTNVYRSSAIYSKLCLKENVAKDESFKRLIYLLIQIIHVEHLIFVIGKCSIFDVIIKMRHTTLYIKFSRTRIYINYFWY